MTAPRRHRSAEIAGGLAALLALAVLLAGLPAALYFVAGSPIPHAVPALHQVTAALTRRDDGALFIGAVRYIGWIAWAAFTFSVAVEIYGQARGGDVPRLAGLGGMQHLARALVTAILVAFSSGAAGFPAAITTVAVPAPAAPAAVVLDAAVQPAAAVTVTVQPGDCLWTLAAQHLGNGDRFPEITALNYGRDMGGGQRFTDPSLIRPGWVLRMPAGAAAAPGTGSTAGSSHGGHPSRHPGFAAPHQGGAPSPAAAPQASAAGTPAPAFTPVAAASSTSLASAPSAPGSQHLPSGAIFAAGLLSGGVLASVSGLRHRQRQDRRPGRRIALPASDEARRAEQAIRSSPAPQQAGALRAALAVLACGLRRDGQPVPPIAGVHLTGTDVDVLLTAPAAGPPPPFRIAPGTQDMCWRAAMSDLTALPPPGAGDLLPGLVTAGTTSAGGHLLIDLEAPGVTTADGPGGLADRLLVTAAAELATNPWAGTFDLLLEGFPELAAASSRAQACRTLDEAIGVLEERVRRMPAGSAAGQARQNRITDPASPDWALTLLAARTTPTPAQMARILDAAAPASGIAALLPGDPAAPDGREAPASLDLRREPGQPGEVTASLHPLGLVLRPHLLDDTGYRALAEIFAAGRAGDVAPGDPPYNSSFPHGSQPEAAPVPAARTARAAEPPAGSGPGSSQDTGTGLRIAILGPLAITGNAEDLQPKQAELVVALALAGPSGLSNEALRGMLGPDEDHPKPPESLRQIITRTRRKLGTTPDGGEYIVYAGNAQYILDPAAQLDWHAFGALAAEGRARPDPRALRSALALLRGRPLDGIYYWWIEPALTEAIRAEIVDAADLLATLELDAGNPAAAGRAARAGLAADPAAEHLWRALMRAEDAAANTAGVHEAWRRCLDAIADVAADGEPHPGTAALYRELTRGHAPAGHR